MENSKKLYKTIYKLKIDRKSKMANPASAVKEVGYSEIQTYLEKIIEYDFADYLQNYTELKITSVKIHYSYKGSWNIIFSVVAHAAEYIYQGMSIAVILYEFFQLVNKIGKDFIKNKLFEKFQIAFLVKSQILYCPIKKTKKEKQPRLICVGFFYYLLISNIILLVLLGFLVFKAVAHMYW